MIEVLLLLMQKVGCLKQILLMYLLKLIKKGKL